MNNKKAVKILSHFGGWLLFIFLIAAFLKNGGSAGKSYFKIIFNSRFILFTLFYTVIFYLNLYVLMPYIFLKKQHTAYSLVFITLLSVCIYIKPFEEVMMPYRNEQQNPAAQKDLNSNRLMPPPPPTGPPPQQDQESRFGQPPPGNTMPAHTARGRRQFDIISLIVFFMAMAGSATLVLFKQWLVTEKNSAQIAIQKAQAELAFLKAQISPHFLFNTLNNIYALAITKNENTASGILRLSNIMRYVTDEARRDFVPVDKEIACINDFIALQKLRLGKKVELNYILTGEYGKTKVAPLILMAFVENTFKHGISNNKPSQINIHINVNELTITLRTQNTVFKAESLEKLREGVGLHNVKQRLELLYPHTHQIQILTEGDKFTVVLVLNNIG
ncbi:MAG: histidine kinase [Niabella sp.]